MAFISKLFLQNYYGKVKNVLTFFIVFYISHKSEIRIFLKWSTKNNPKSICLLDP